jgi:YD repeat-containing protein
MSSRRWDALRRLSALENETGSVYGFQYDSVGRLLREQGFDGKATEYRYDEASGVLAETVEAGVTTRLDFDARVKGISSCNAHGQMEGTRK